MINLPWEAIVTLLLSAIGFVAWLTKISIMQDVGNDKLKEIQAKVSLIEATYVKMGDFSWLKERVESGFDQINHRIDEMGDKK